MTPVIFSFCIFEKHFMSLSGLWTQCILNDLEHCFIFGSYSVSTTSKVQSPTFYQYAEKVTCIQNHFMHMPTSIFCELRSLYTNHLYVFHVSEVSIFFFLDLDLPLNTSTKNLKEKVNSKRRWRRRSAFSLLLNVIQWHMEASVISNVLLLVLVTILITLNLVSFNNKTSTNLIIQQFVK